MKDVFSPNKKVGVLQFKHIPHSLPNNNDNKFIKCLPHHTFDLPINLFNNPSLTKFLLCISNFTTMFFLSCMYLRSSLWCYLAGACYLFLGVSSSSSSFVTLFMSGSPNYVMLLSHGWSKGNHYVATNEIM